MRRGTGVFRLVRIAEMIVSWCSYLPHPEFFWCGQHAGRSRQIPGGTEDEDLHVVECAA